jgi:hypothetical protein
MWAQYWKMLNNAPGTMVKELNMVKKIWNLCSQFLKSIKSVVFYIKFSFFSFLKQCPRSTG